MSSPIPLVLQATTVCHEVIVDDKRHSDDQVKQLMNSLERQVVGGVIV